MLSVILSREDQFLRHAQGLRLVPLVHYRVGRDFSTILLLVNFTFVIENTTAYTRIYKALMTPTVHTNSVSAWILAAMQ